MLAHRISELEHAVTNQLAELRNEVGLAAAAMRAGAADAPMSPIADLEQQLARAVTVSLSAALEAIRVALTEAVSSAIAQLALRLEASVETQLSSVASQVSSAPNRALHPQWDAEQLENVSTSLQHSVLLALSSFERTIFAPSSTDPLEAPATARDVAKVNQRLDDLRSLLLG
jgi:hypothetical protein